MIVLTEGGYRVGEPLSALGGGKNTEVTDRFCVVVALSFLKRYPGLRHGQFGAWVLLVFLVRFEQNPVFWVKDSKGVITTMRLVPQVAIRSEDTGCERLTPCVPRFALFNQA